MRVVLADLDATLVDTVQLLVQGQYQACCEAVTAAGGHSPSLEQFRQVFAVRLGGTLTETLTATLSQLYPGPPWPEHPLLGRIEVEQLCQRVDAIQSQLAARLIRPADGLHHLLDTLRTLGLPLGIVTSGRPLHLVRNLSFALPHLGCSHLYHRCRTDSSATGPYSAGARAALNTLSNALQIDLGVPVCLITSGDVCHAKPHPEPILLALDRLGASPSQAWMIGDHSVDMQAAQAAGVARRIGITTGLTSAGQLRLAGATDIATTLHEVAKLLQG